jgi:hypothetical protein
MQSERIMTAEPGTRVLKAEPAAIETAMSLDFVVSRIAVLGMNSVGARHWSGSVNVVKSCKLDLCDRAAAK